MDSDTRKMQEVFNHERKMRPSREHLAGSREAFAGWFLRFWRITAARDKNESLRIFPRDGSEVHAAFNKRTTCSSLLNTAGGVAYDGVKSTRLKIPKYTYFRDIRAALFPSIPHPFPAPRSHVTITLPQRRKLLFCRRFTLLGEKF